MAVQGCRQGHGRAGFPKGDGKFFEYFGRLLRFKLIEIVPFSAPTANTANDWHDA